MQRYFISLDQKSTDSIKIIGEDVHHIKNVLRATIGDTLIACDGQGIDYYIKIKSIHRNEIECGILERHLSIAEPITKVTIAQSLPKKEKFEWILQKGTEIGAVRFLPFISERTVVKVDKKKMDHKVTRWKRIVKEAAEQAHRGKVPQVDAPRSWLELLDEIQRTDVAYIAYEKGGEALGTQLASTSSRDILLVIGPEGGFTENEIAEAQERGAVAISLGSRILRTETAPLVALSCILFQKNDLGGDTR